MTKANTNTNSPYMSLQEFIGRQAVTTISYQNLSYTQPFADIIFPMQNILDDYIDYFRDRAISITFTDDEYFLYKYKPRLLSYYLYGSTELFFVILALNGMATEKEFTKQTVKLLPSDVLTSLIQTIYSAESQNISTYNNRMMREYLDTKNNSEE